MFGVYSFIGGTMRFGKRKKSEFQYQMKNAKPPFEHNPPSFTINEDVWQELGYPTEIKVSRANGKVLLSANVRKTVVVG